MDGPAPDRLGPAAFDLADLFDLVDDALLVAEVDRGRVVLWNPSALRLFGYSGDEAANLSLGQIFRHGEGGRLQVSLVGYPATRPHAAVGVPLDTTALRRHGKPFRVQLVLRPLTPARPLPGHYVLVHVRPLATRRRLAEAQLRHERLLGAKMEARTARHHLSNHLALTLGSLELLLESAGLDQAAQALTVQALTGAQEAATTLEQLAQLTELVESPDWSPLGPLLDVAAGTSDAPGGSW